LNTFSVEPRSTRQFEPFSAAKGSISTVACQTTAWIEVGIVFSLILVAVWTPMGRINTAASLSAVIAILWFSARSNYTLRELGLVPGVGGTLLTIGLGAVLAIALATSGAFMRPVLGPSHPVPMDRAWQYAIWAVVQEFILQSFFYVRLKSVLGHRRAALVAALLFAVVHIPSPALTILSFLGGLLFCELFNRYKNLVPIGLVHALLGLTIAASLPDSLLHHMRVGIGYLTYHP
jgi:membrane protease YdiL (CAAX protease family)